MKKPCIFNWSGGKDSSLALYHALKNPEFDIRYLVTTINDAVNRVSMHGVRESLLQAQAQSIGIPLYQIRLPEMPGMKEYDEIMHFHLSKFKEEGITHSIFGDIFLEDLKKYREDKLAEVGMEAIFPLWQRPTADLIKEFMALGFETVVVCAKEKLEAIVGKVINPQFIKELPTDVDVCGENGEYHTFAFKGPIFKKSIDYTLGEKVFKAYKTPKDKDYSCFTATDDKPENLGFWYIDLLD